MRIWLTQNELWRGEKNTGELLRKEGTKEHTNLREKEKKDKEKELNNEWLKEQT